MSVEDPAELRAALSILHTDESSLVTRIARTIANFTQQNMMRAIVGGSVDEVLRAIDDERAESMIKNLHSGDLPGHGFHGNQYTDVASADTGKPEMRAPTHADAARLKALVVPPAWKHVRVSVDPHADLQVTGIDAKGRTQYRYSAEHSERAAGEKFARLREFHKELPMLRTHMKEDLHDPKLSPADREAASALYLIDRTAFRVGSDRETGGDAQAYGATTLLTKHVKVNDDTVDFDFIGKKGVRITKSVEDPLLAKIVRQHVKDSADGRLFQTSDSAVRDYLHARDGDFKVKDFRTWHGTQLALSEIKKMPIPKTKTELAKAQRQVSTVVAAHLGNTPTVARASYIDPGVWSRWKT